MALIYFLGAVWFACAALFCLAVAAAAHAKTPEMAKAEVSNIIPFDPHASVASDDNEVFLEDWQERKAA
jgi:hypothetical protein